MARIRSIHPGLLTDEAFMVLTVEAPLAVTLLLGLWMEADDQGLFPWRPLTLKARVLPAVSADIGPLLEALERGRFICRFEVEGRPYGAIRNFCRWQRPKKPNAVHPTTPEVRAWTGSGGEPVGNQSRTGVEIQSRMEDVGGRMEESSPPKPPSPGGNAGADLADQRGPPDPGRPTGSAFGPVSPSARHASRLGGAPVIDMEPDLGADGRGREAKPIAAEAEGRTGAIGPALAAEFAEFWRHFPHKVGKGAAERAFRTARRKVELAPMLAALERYQATKPHDRPWCNPSTWLNQERWLDEPGPEPVKTSGFEPKIKSSRLMAMLVEDENADRRNQTRYFDEDDRLLSPTKPD
ncbi:MAG: hypothetical protein ACRC67_09535 [Inquilinus sp.]|uniref:hypothetical protein n=1 Tax=Inquilinus sp. TaxID=1932117 RepID=UPI003F31138D